MSKKFKVKKQCDMTNDDHIELYLHQYSDTPMGHVISGLHARIEALEKKK